MPSPAPSSFLTSPAGQAALADAAGYAISGGSLIGDIAALRQRYGSQTPALVEQVTLRRRAEGKLRDPGELLLTDEALQQATPTAVAARRAERLRGLRVHDVTCSIGAELRELVGRAAVVLGSDLDPGRARLAHHNAPGAAVFVADALTISSGAEVILADPARRAGGRRIAKLADLQPNPLELRELYAGRTLALKCAPGIDYQPFLADTEVEVVSLDGSVREAGLWSGPLAEPGVRRAVVLGRNPFELDSNAPETERVDAPGRYLIDPDGAVVRAGLVRHYAARHGLWQLDPRIAYLTGDAVPPGQRGFEVLAELPLREPVLRRELAARDCGALEILVRGVDVDPDALRKRLKLRGSVGYALVITRVGADAVVYLTAAPPPVR